MTSGVRKMREVINKLFTWPGMGSEIREYVKGCEVCSKMNKKGNRGMRMQGM